MRDKAELKQMLDDRDRTIARLLEELKKRKKPSLNRECSKVVHFITRKLKKEENVRFDFDFSVSHPHNAHIIDRIVEGAMRHIKSKEYTKMDAEEACQRYFSNLKDEHRRELRGTKEQHLKCMRRNSRKDTKLKMRLSGLKSKFCPLPPAQKLKAKDILHIDYTSSDDDEIDTSEDGTEYRNVRLLPWESSEAKHIKAVLLDTHVQHVLGNRDRTRMQKLRRNENCSISERPRPENAPYWSYIN